MYIPYIRMYIPKFRTEPRMAVGSGAHTSRHRPVGRQPVAGRATLL